jgi:hypothetical protein
MVWMMRTKTIITSIALLLVITVPLVFSTTSVNAQNITQIISNVTMELSPQCDLKAQAEELGMPELLSPGVDMDNPCAEIIYESLDRVVLLGELIEYSEYNQGIWKVVDALEDAGWRMESNFLTGEGSEQNPHDYIISLTK